MLHKFDLPPSPLPYSQESADSITPTARLCNHSFVSSNLVGGGFEGPAPTMVIDYVNTASTGNALDFGDTLAANQQQGGTQSPTRGLLFGGNPRADSTIELFTIASTGNTSDFGDLHLLGTSLMGSCLSSPVRAIVAGGANPGIKQNIEYVTIASTGNSTNFGNMTTSRDQLYSNSDSIRGVLSGGQNPSTLNSMEYIKIMSEGNGVNFGDLTSAKKNGFDSMGTSHGGL